MATLVDQEFFARLRALNEKFAATVPATLARLQAARMQCSAAHRDAAKLRELHQILHTIAGSAGTFGFAALGRQARVIEQHMRALMARETAATEAEWDAWLGSVDLFLRWAAIDPRADTFDSGFQ